MVTTDAAAAMGLEGFRLEMGGAAHLVVLDQPDIREALRNHARPRHVVSHGRLIDAPAMQAIVDTNGLG
jgi:cytosine deaminase